MAGQSTSKLVVYAALTANLLIALTKLGAAWWTGSSAMLSESVHSFVDTGNQALLLYGIHRAAKPPDESHPIGYGRELYFWSFIVALLMFTIGAGVTFFEGVMHVRESEPIVDPIVNFVVLGLSAVFESATWLYALHEFRKTATSGNLLKAARRSKDPPTFMVLFEDSAALRGQRGTDRPFHRLCRHIVNQLFQCAGARWRRLDRNQRLARRHRRCARDRNQGAADRRAG
jgi:cation diffusion facilitator family transporter